MLPKYRIEELKDLSHAGAKRYSAVIVLSEKATDEAIKIIAEKATKTIRLKKYYRDNQVKKRWGRTKAHVVWLYFVYDADDIQDKNWICQTSWINASLSDDMKPLPLKGNDSIGDIQVLWNGKYESLKQLYRIMKGEKSP